MLPAGSLPPQQSSGRDFRVGSTGAAPGGAQEEEHEKAASLELNDPILPVEGRRAELDEVLTGSRLLTTGYPGTSLLILGSRSGNCSGNLSTS